MNATLVQTPATAAPVDTYGTCHGCGWYLRIIRRTDDGHLYCITCADHARLIA